MIFIAEQGQMGLAISIVYTSHWSRLLSSVSPLRTCGCWWAKSDPRTNRPLWWRRRAGRTWRQSQCWQCWQSADTSHGTHQFLSLSRVKPSFSWISWGFIAENANSLKLNSVELFRIMMSVHQAATIPCLASLMFSLVQRKLKKLESNYLPTFI